MRRLLLLVIFVVLALAPAGAQIVSIYATFSPTHLSNVRNGYTGNSSTASYTTTTFWAPGIGGGVTLNFLPLGPVKLGFDFRGATKPGTNGYDLGMFGIRGGIKVPLIAFKPYLQASGGYLATRVDYSAPGTTSFSSTGKYAVYEILGGIDYSILPFIDIRIIELGGGQAYAVLDSLSFGTTPPPNRPTVFTINSGVVFHF